MSFLRKLPMQGLKSRIAVETRDIGFGVTHRVVRIWEEDSDGEAGIELSPDAARRLRDFLIEAVDDGSVKA